MVERWDATRDFYVILDGTADVFVDGERVSSLGAGDFFGELAALDWGAGYGYPRLATVVAASRLRMLVFSPDAFAELLRFEDVERRIRMAVRKRLERR